MICFFPEEKNVFCTNEPTFCERNSIDSGDIGNILNMTDQQSFMMLSEKTEQTIKSAMKCLEVFGERLEKAKTLLSTNDFTQTIESDQTMDGIINNTKFKSQLVQDMLKLKNDIRDMRERFAFSKKKHYPMSHLEQEFDISKKNLLDASKTKHLKKTWLTKKDFETFEKQLAERFPILSSELSISQTETPDSIILTESDSDSNDSTLITTNHCETNKSLFLGDKVLNTEVSWESIPEFYQPLNFETFLKNNTEFLSFSDTNDDIENIDTHFSYIEPKLVGRLFQAMKRLSIDSSNENIHNIDKNYNNKLKIEAALKILEDY